MAVNFLREELSSFLKISMQDAGSVTAAGHSADVEFMQQGGPPVCHLLALAPVPVCRTNSRGTNFDSKINHCFVN